MLKTEWVKDDKMECVSLYVNDTKTNVYYFLPSYKHFALISPDEKPRAIETAFFIESLMIQRDDWNMFDMCASCNVACREIQIVGKELTHYKNKIVSITGYEPIYMDPAKQQEVINQYAGTSIYTQYTKRNVSGRLSDKFGIVFAPYGYALYFI